MSSACTPILVGVAFPVSEILLLSKMAKFPFLTMDYSPWLSKYSINWNRLKNFMQVGIDVKCMYTNFGGRGLSGFGDKISVWSIKMEKFNRSESAQKFMHVGVDVTCMHTSLGGCDPSAFGDMATFQKRPNFPFGAWTSKNSIDRNRLKKFMQVGSDVKCMRTDFGGCGLSGFGDKISLWSIKVEKFNRSESARKINATRGRCHVHSHQFWWVWSLRFQRYGYLSKTAKFPFWGMDYSPWSSKNLIDRNRLKKFMQVGIDVKFMYTNFGGRDLSSFGDMATFKNGQISLLGHGL